MLKIRPLDNRSMFAPIVVGTIICPGCGCEVFVVKINKYSSRKNVKIVEHFLNSDFRRCDFSNKSMKDMAEGDSYGSISS